MRQAVSLDRISIHASREGGDLYPMASALSLAVFQSTPPVREATKIVRIKLNPNPFQSTPPVREATVSMASALSLAVFQSTPPVREATKNSQD